jgi:hypothetical protein
VLPIVELVHLQHLVIQPDGHFEPFHVYSMRQAIEEGFILDVLKNYMTYSTSYKIAREIEDNPELPKRLLPAHQ